MGADAVRELTIEMLAQENLELGDRIGALEQENAELTERNAHLEANGSTYHEMNSITLTALQRTTALLDTSRETIKKLEAKIRRLESRQ